MTDHGPGPYVLDVEQATLDNDSFRTVLWSGEHLQLTAMAIPVGEDIGLEVHPDNDQFLRVEAGRAHVRGVLVETAWSAVRAPDRCGRSIDASPPVAAAAVAARAFAGC